MNEKIKSLIDKLEIDDQSKQELLQSLEKDGATPDLMEKIKAVLQKAEEGIRSQYSSELKELETIYEDAGKQIDKAYYTYEKEMDEIEKEADKVDKDTSKQMDKLEMEEARSALKE